MKKPKLPAATKRAWRNTSSARGLPDIQQVVVLMLENRSFDHMLGSCKSLYPGLDGIDPNHPGANRDAHRTFYQQPGAAFQLPDGIDPHHDAADARDQINVAGPCGGFVNNFLRFYPGNVRGAQEVMNYFDRQKPDRLPVLHGLAEAYTICDRWFCSVLGPTWANRFFMHSGTARGRVHMPSSVIHHWNWYKQTTLFDRLNERDIPWRIYFGDIPQSLALVHQRTLGNLRGYRRMKHFGDDLADGTADHLRYIFIEPSYFGADQNDQHPPSDVRRGERLVAQVYNALRRREEAWRKTLLIVLYDEHGGFYDHVYPGQATPPDRHMEDGFPFDQFGVRVPALLIGPHAPAAVSNLQFDHTSILRFLIDLWGLGNLGDRTKNAVSIAEALSTLPREDTPGPIPVPPEARMRTRHMARAAAPADGRPLNEYQQSLLALSELLGTETPPTRRAPAILRAPAVIEPAAHVDAARERVLEYLRSHGATP